MAILQIDKQIILLVIANLFTEKNRSSYIFLASCLLITSVKFVKLKFGVAREMLYSNSKISLLYSQYIVQFILSSTISLSIYYVHQHHVLINHVTDSGVSREHDVLGVQKRMKPCSFGNRYVQVFVYSYERLSFIAKTTR